MTERADTTSELVLYKSEDGHNGEFDTKCKTVEAAATDEADFSETVRPSKGDAQ
jgi:hypothetical protein